eukprot:s3158_g13.t1
MRGLQLLGRHYPQAGQVQGAAQVQDSAHLRDAVQHRGDAQQRGAGRALRSGQVRGAEGALQAAALPEDPISDFDDSFELVEEDAPLPQPALRAFRFCGGDDRDESPPMHSATARGSRQRSTSTEVHVGRRIETDESMETSTGHSSSSGNTMAEVDPPEGQRGVWDPLPAETVQLTETGVQVGSPQISRAVPTDEKAPLRKAPPPPQNIWAQATILEVRQLRRENRMLQEIFEPGVLQRDDVATVTELVEAAQGWRHHPKSQPNPKTEPLSVLRTEGAVDVDATLSGPNVVPDISAPPVLVGASDLPHPFRCGEKLARVREGFSVVSFGFCIYSMRGWPHSWEQVAIFASTALLPFCCLRQLDPLKEISAAAMLIVIFLFLYICFDLPQGDFAQVQDANFTRQGFEYAYPIISVAFTAHYNGPRYFSELGDLDHFYCVILLVFVSCLVVYSLFAVRGVMIFGRQTRPDLLNNLHAPWMGDSA